MAFAESPLLIEGLDSRRCQSSSSASLDTLIRDFSTLDDPGNSLPSDMDWFGDGTVEVGVTLADTAFEAPPASHGSWDWNPVKKGMHRFSHSYLYAECVLISRMKFRRI